MNKKNGWILAIFIIIGIVIGGFLGRYFAVSPYLSWLNYGKIFSFSPKFDIGIIQFFMDLKFNITIASIIGIFIAILVYKKVK